MDIILYLLNIIQEQHQQICWLILFICRYIPLKQWAHDEIHSPAYQKFTTDKLPVIKTFIKQGWQLWNEYYRLRYGKAVSPISLPFYSGISGLDFKRCRSMYPYHAYDF